jgi:hypothetical protein
LTTKYIPILHTQLLKEIFRVVFSPESEVVKAGLDFLQQHSTSPAALAEGLGLIGSFSIAAQEGGTTSRGRDHSALLRQKLSRQQSQQRLSRSQP